jgi:hypothetical protein
VTEAIQQNEQELAYQPLKLAHPPKEPLSAKRTIYAVGSPEKGSALGASVPSTLLDARLPPNPFVELVPVERENKAAAGTIRIILENVNRRGHSSASLPDGKVLVVLEPAAVLRRGAGFDRSRLRPC